MEFISAKEFSNQPKEVQEVFMEWWQPSIGDLFCDVNAYNNTFLDCIYNNNKNEVIESDKKHGYYIPLFTEGQLRKFIENKMCGRIETIDYLSDGYDFYYYDEYNNQYCIGEELGDDLLQAYWKVALEVAKESVE
ncbi:hypothetical protein, partial [Clostridium sp.]|uniref:hypothetical protein n=1 Tax=Clostridium sp. TaxID=1506 RepID=UPI003217C2FE